MSTIRAFIAIPIPSEVQQLVGNLVKRLQSKFPDGIKWVKEESFHLTLKFLGNIREEEINKIVEKIRESIGWSKTFKFKFDYVSCFPNWYKPRVVWLGMKKIPKELITIHTNLEKNLMSLGFKKEGRVFKPHLTLGRIKRLNNSHSFREELEKNFNFDIPEIEVTKVHLYRSILKREGAEYVILRTVELPI